MNMGFRQKLGKSRDMTEGVPIRLILGFALPLFLGNVFQMFYNMADAAIVGKFLGPLALASVGAAGPAYNLFTMVISGFAGGASVVVGQAFGSGNRENTRRAYTTSILLLFLSGLCVTVLGFALAEPLLRVLLTPEEVLSGCLTYLRWMCVGVLATCLYNGAAAILRAVGDSVTPLFALVISSILNILMDYLFVVPLGMGISGAAAATLLAQLASGLYCLVSMYRRMPVFRARLREYRIYGDLLRKIVRLGLPAALSSGGVILSVLLIQRAVNVYGTTVVAAYTAANRGENICMCLSYSMGLATGVFAAQNVGARDYDRVSAGLRAGLKLCLIYHVAIALLMWFAAPWLMGLFSDDPEVIRIGVEITKIIALFAPVLGALFIFQNFLRSVSDVFPTVLMSVAEIVSRGLLPYLLSAGFGYAGIWWATPVGWILSLSIGLLRFFSGRWKQIMRAQSVGGAQNREKTAPSA